MLAGDGCTTHRDKCRFGQRHTWSIGNYIETNEDGTLRRIGFGQFRRDIYWCFTCDGLCYAEATHAGRYASVSSEE